MPVPSALEPASGWPLRSSSWPREPVRVGRRLRRFPVTGRRDRRRWARGSSSVRHLRDRRRTRGPGRGPGASRAQPAVHALRTAHRAGRNLGHRQSRRPDVRDGALHLQQNPVGVRWVAEWQAAFSARAATSVLPTQSRPFSHSCRCWSYGRSLLPHTAEAGPRGLTPAARSGVPPLGQLLGGWGRPTSTTTSDSGGRICDDRSKVLVLRRR